MIIYHQTHVATFVGAHVWFWPLQPIRRQFISATSAAPSLVVTPYYYQGLLAGG